MIVILELLLIVLGCLIVSGAIICAIRYIEMMWGGRQ